MIITLLYISILSLHSQAILPSIDDTLVLEEWNCLGPFSIGMREGIIGVDEKIELNPDFEPDTTMLYPSIFVQGGYVHWKKVVPEASVVKIEYPDVLWDTILDYYGVAGVLAGSYAYAEFDCDGTKRALVCARGISSFRLNGTPYAGDTYRDGFLQVPVLLQPGVNRILLKLSGFTTHSFDFRVLSSSSPVLLVLGDITKPDVIKRDQDSILVAVPVMNTTGQRPDNLTIDVEGECITASRRLISNIMPFSCVKVPIWVHVQDLTQCAKESLEVTVSLSSCDFRDEAVFYLHIKGRDEAHKRTFLSNIDNSCQYYAVLPPEDYNPESTYALIMTCHGAGVMAENQVKSYTQKEWAFVVAPTNRRRYGFDWQDWGRLDFLEVMEDVKKHYNIDENRVYLTGHSMGGHGVWHIGTRHPDLFAAIAPSAGWTDFQLYVPWFLQKSETYAHPDLIKYRDIVLRTDNPLLYIENLKNVPVYILQGGADDNVPPIQGRMFAQVLDRLGYNFIYNEIPEKGHWWDIDSTPGVDCVDLRDMMEFMRAHARSTSSTNDSGIVEDTTIKYAYFSPFVLIYGTTGDSLSIERNFNQARMQSYVWWYRANGFAEILPDTELTRDIVKNYNLILFGNAETNSVLKWIYHKLPIRIEENTVLIDNKPLAYEDLCLVEIYPNPLNPEKYVLVYSPTSTEAEKIMGLFTPLYAGAGLPDYIVYDKSALTFGWGGIVAAGFFDKKWNYDPTLCFMKDIE